MADEIRDLSLVIANAIPLDQLMMMVEDAIKEYRADPTERQKGFIFSLCSMMLSKAIMEGQPGGLEKMKKDMAEIEQAKKLFKNVKEN